MLRVVFTLLVLVSAGLAQTSSDGSFSVRHVTDTSYSLSPSQMREPERLYQSACTVVQHEYQSDVELRPHFTVVIGTERDELNFTRTEPGEIGMKTWDPIKFTQGSVILAFEQMLTPDAIVQLGNRVVRQYDTTVDVADFSKPLGLAARILSSQR